MMMMKNKKPQDENIMSACATQGGHNNKMQKFVVALFIRRLTSCPQFALLTNRRRRRRRYQHGASRRVALTSTDDTFHRLAGGRLLSHPVGSIHLAFGRPRGRFQPRPGSHPTEMAIGRRNARLQVPMPVVKNTNTYFNTRMWANAQPDGRPVEYR